MNNILIPPFTRRCTMVLAIVFAMGLLACPEADSDGPSSEADRAPNAPHYFTMFAGDTELTIMWGAPTDTGIINGDGSAGTITGYKVYYSTTDGFDITDTTGVTSAEVSATTYTITGLTGGTMYYVVVTAFNATGESALSAQMVGVPGVLVAWSTYNKDNPVVQTRTGTAINTLDDLNAMTANGEYYLTNNINLGARWTPLHTKDTPFTGTLYGNGYILYNMNINDATATYQGLFAALNDANIENLGIGVGTIAVGALVGALAGSVTGTVTGTSSLTNIAAGRMTATSEITASGLEEKEVGLDGSHIGGIVGYLGIHSTLINGWNEHLTVKATVKETGTTGVLGMVGGLVGYNLFEGQVIGTASGHVSSQSGSEVGGLVGDNSDTGTVTGYSRGWVTTSKDNAKSAFGAVVGGNTNPANTDTDTVNAYYNSDDGAGGTADHVGTIDAASATKINGTVTGATGERGTSDFGVAINGVTNATATNMGTLTAGTEVGQWAFTAGQWPRLNLPEDVTDFMDYTTSPAKPANFFD